MSAPISRPSGRQFPKPDTSAKRVPEADVRIFKTCYLKATPPQVKLASVTNLAIIGHRLVLQSKSVAWSFQKFQNTADPRKPEQAGADSALAGRAAQAGKKTNDFLIDYDKRYPAGTQRRARSLLPIFAAALLRRQASQPDSAELATRQKAQHHGAAPSFASWCYRTRNATIIETYVGARTVAFPPSGVTVLLTSEAIHPSDVFGGSEARYAAL
jgi:hypothetical protein